VLQKLTLEFLEKTRAVVARRDYPMLVVSWDRQISFMMFTGAPDDLVELSYHFYSPVDSLDARLFAESLVESRIRDLNVTDCNTTYSIPFVW
jgi:hypothetical protein